MEILGYSERGIINSLFYEMKFSQNNLRLLNDFLSLISLPYRTVDFRVSDAKILIEQSFSDFGDADVVLLVNNRGGKQAIFIEAKFKTNIRNEFENFKSGIRESEPPRGFSSNLFVQLYFKTRLIKALKSRSFEDAKKQLQEEGLQFPECLSKKDRKTNSRRRPRKIGKNKVVEDAIRQLKGYCKDALFIALVPDDISRLKDFYQNTLRDRSPKELKELQEWDIRNWGYLSWTQVEEFCERYNL
jgi:hypothetical protein